jgi:hypothetical protein
MLNVRPPARRVLAAYADGLGVPLVLCNNCMALIDALRVAAQTPPEYPAARGASGPEYDGFVWGAEQQQRAILDIADDLEAAHEARKQSA